ncbi:MAG TPA: radical SAM protein [Thermoplasmataceae archaeon]|nr:radical SAM protein [Thermoplasmatales archaeon AK]HLH85780.1 radical SAM protein [Thermoplasmataceae archaeon]
MTITVANIRNGVVTVGEERGDTFAFDLEGRPIFALIDGRMYRRGLMNSFLQIGANNHRHFALPLSNSAASEIVKEIRVRATKIVETSRLGESEEMAYFMSRLNALDWENLKIDSQKLLSAYGGPVSIVPPDQYFPLYIRYSHGCTWNRCTFCTLYTGVRPKVLSADEVEIQTKRLVNILGKGIQTRRTVFIGDGNPINADFENFAELLEKIRAITPLPIDTFLDTFTREFTGDEIEKLAKLGLHKIYVGLESASSEVLRILNKPIRLDSMARLIGMFRKAGVLLGLIVLAGAGGVKFERIHREATAEYIASLPMSSGDTVFISPIEVANSSRYRIISESEELGDFSDDEKITEAERLKDHIILKWRIKHGTNPPFQIAPYMISESIY